MYKKIAFSFAIRHTHRRLLRLALLRTPLRTLPYQTVSDRYVVCELALCLLPPLPRVQALALEHAARLGRVGGQRRRDVDPRVCHRGGHPVLLGHAQPHELALRRLVRVRALPLASVCAS